MTILREEGELENDTEQADRSRPRRDRGTGQAASLNCLIKE